MSATALSASAERSTAGISPRWRDGVATAAERRSAPSTGTPEPSSRASRSSCSCRSEATRLRITPASRTRGSQDAKPCTSAATERDCEEPSTTSTTGARSSLATCAVEASSPRPEAPSNRPMTPSTTATSAPAAPCRNSGAIRSGPHMKASRLRPGRPAASAW